MKHHKKIRLPISTHAEECLKDLRANFTDRAYGNLGRQARGSIELAFLRGYQGSYEDAIMGKKPQHYVRSKKKIKEENGE